MSGNLLTRKLCADLDLKKSELGPYKRSKVDRPLTVDPHMEAANLSSLPCGVAQLDSFRAKVQQATKQFWSIFNEKKKEEPDSPRIDISTADYMKKKGLWINTEKLVGHVPGIEIGEKFHFRAELMVVGLHRRYVSGIDYLVVREKKFAISIVNSGRYENEAISPDVLVYSGEGGLSKSREEKDQMFARGNLAMVNSMKAGYPVRVITNRRIGSEASCSGTLVYDGLYIIREFWQERAKCGKLVFKFQLHRSSGQKIPPVRFAGTVHCVVDDLSEGEENTPIRALNGLDRQKPPAFTYISTVAYPEWCKQIEHGGCTCSVGCSSSAHCICIRRNEPETGVVFECGLNCNCPPSCRNRASQRGLRYQLEVFRTDSGEWGVRSRGFISSGSFVCEFVGKLQQINSVPLSSDGRRDYLVDSTKLGNVARFIRRSSSSPNLVVRHVVFDKMIPHIMLFASKSIPPLHELTHAFGELGKFRY